MAMIKSALELALERTRDLKADEAALKGGEAKIEGRKAAGKFIENPSPADFDASLRRQAPELREVFRKAAYEVLVSQLQLPTGPISQERMAAIAQGVGTLAQAAPSRGPLSLGADKKASGLVQQIAAFLSKYLEDLKKVEQAIRTQWAPKLRDKERQLAARMGQDVRLDPMQDPEFSAFYKQNVENLRSSYADALEKAKDELAVLCGFAPEEGE